MIVVHHLNDSRSERILWLLEELGLPYEVKRYFRDPETKLAPPDLVAIHPLGKSPVIVDDGRTVAETGAIVEYLTGRYGNGRLVPPPGSEEKLRYTYWLHFAEGSAMPPAVMKLVFTLLPQSVPFWIKPIAKLISQGMQDRFIDPTLAKQMDFMEAELGRDGKNGGGWFAGDAFTAADIMMSFPLETAKARGALGPYPRMTGWLEAIHARPAYQAALARGGPYAYA
jgi:glutathione S-transferase